MLQDYREQHCTVLACTMLFLYTEFFPAFGNCEEWGFALVSLFQTLATKSTTASCRGHGAKGVAPSLPILTIGRPKPSLLKIPGWKLGVGKMCVCVWGGEGGSLTHCMWLPNSYWTSTCSSEVDIVVLHAHTHSFLAQWNKFFELALPFLYKGIKPLWQVSMCKCSLMYDVQTSNILSWAGSLQLIIYGV